MTCAPAEPLIRRGEWIGRLLPLPLLIASTVLAGLSTSGGLTSTARFQLGAGVAAAAAVWSLVVVAPMHGRGVRWRTVAFTGHLAFAAVLVEANGWYSIYAFGGYLLVDLLPPRWRRRLFVANAMVLAAGQVGGWPTEGFAIVAYAALCAVNIALVITLVAFGDRVMVQNEKLAAALAENAGLHAQLVAQAREAGVLDERQRLAGEIHDTLAQGLIGIVTQLEAAEQARRVPEQWQRHVAQARELARANLTDARRSVQALRPEQLERGELGPALTELAHRQSGPVQVSVDVAGPVRRLPRPVEDALFRVAQEALANVRHAHAGKVGITVTYLDDVVLLDVRDDGIGVDLDALTARTQQGYGLDGMRRRLAGVGGHLELESAPGEGMALSAAVPA